MIKFGIVIFIFIMALAGYLLRSLSVSGFIAAFFVGLFISIGFGFKGLLLLGIFFATSSLWSNFKRTKKNKIEEVLQKGHVRDYSQVLANGLIPAVSSILYSFSPEEIWIYAFCFSLAAANADTWASEIGSLSKEEPIDFLTFKRVRHGTSGAISLLGIIATVLGAITIGIFSIILFPSLSDISLLYISLAGILGSVFDTLIGATIQAKYICPKCGLNTESPSHCAERTMLTKGFKWMDNEWTNFTSILMAALLVGILYFIF
jgi:uncharacterized protein (TIGR00297 family)